ncbi:MAG TPA: FecR domain-containing protein [Terriglobia bacterium]|nr:FecR domain-containing protein [Terriglobia bacterium]
MRYDHFRRVLVVVVAGLFLPATLFTQQKPSASGARLSSLTGSVMVKGPGAAEAVPAQVNMPIEEGSEVSTSAASSASVQLENASTVQLGELTKANFARTEGGQDGRRQNVIILDQGQAHFHFIANKQDNYKVQIADATISPNGKAAFQAGFSKGKMGLSVLEGSIVVSARSGSLTLEKGRSLEYDPSAEPMAAASHVRVVRLSYLRGTVTVKRPGTAEEEKALLNTPIQEGFELSTADSSYAEVEFENGSTARIGEQSKLLFDQLALDAKGNKLNGITFEQGYGTFNFVPERHSANQHERNGTLSLQLGDQDVYRVKIANTTLNADGKCEFRTDLAEDRYRVEVFKGSVEVATDQQTMKLAEGKVFVQENGGTTLTANKITKDDWDQWTEARDRQAQLTGKDESVHANGPAYGWSDLNTYGEWVTLPGNRFGWSPYAPVGWSPFTYGMWNWYAGMGWTWISADPWGWMTDHCGMWDFDPTFGWFWDMPMFGCGLWYPSLVNWYAGPGWYGWAPIGPRPILPVAPGPGRPHPPRWGPQPGRPAMGIVKVPASVIQKGQMITPQTADHVPATAANRIAQPPFEPSLRTTSVSNPVASNATRAAPGAPASGLTFASRHATAPPTILMGGNAARESSLLARNGFHSGREPLRAAQGTTLGGRYQVYGSSGEFRGSASTGRGWFGRGGGVGGHSGGPVISGRSGGSGPVVASHGSSGGGYGGGGGGASSGSGGGGGHSSGGGMASGGGVSSGGGGGASAGGGGGHH